MESSGAKGQAEIICAGSTLELTRRRLYVRGQTECHLFESSAFESKRQDGLLLMLDHCAAKKPQVTEPEEQLRKGRLSCGV